MGFGAKGKAQGFVRRHNRITTANCGLRQTLGCSANYRVLLPLWRDEEACTSLRISQHKHRDLRIYLVGPDCLALRPKCPGVGWHARSLERETRLELATSSLEG